MHVMQDQAQAANVEIRRYFALGTNQREYYTEVPFTVEIDGPFYGVLNFFERVGKLERIINVSQLTMATPKKATDAKVKRTYDYSPGESVVASFTATTFFSHDLAAPAAPAKPGAAGAK
jgi:type IV pilus assembly protein PilO